MSLTTDFCAQRAALSPEAVAFVDDETGQRVTFAEVNDQAARLAAKWQAAGMPKGARLAVLCQNCIGFFVALFAAQKAGMILAPLNWRQPVAELDAVVASVAPAMILHDPEHAEPAAELAARHDMTVMDLWAIDAYCGDIAPLAQGPVDETAPWYLLFTSGTTGTPKAVIQTARMGLANAVNAAQATGLSTATTHLSFLPLFHTAGINLYTLPVYLFGGSTRILRKFDAGAVLRLMTAGACSHFFGVPAVYQALSLLPEIADADLSGLQGLGCGGAALPADQVRFFAERGAVIQAGFGMTETGPMGFLTDKDVALRKVGSVGRPQMLTEARVAGGGETGELQLRGPTITPGYFNNPAATEAAFTDDGWLRSGDVVRRDAEGDYFVVDRIKDMYISGAENVYPAEVERVLVAHETVLEAAVIGVPDARWGEVGVAFVLAQPGHVPDAGVLTDWCRARLAKYKIPVRFEMVDDFPRTASGKIRKPLLKERA